MNESKESIDRTAEAVERLFNVSDRLCPADRAKYVESKVMNSDDSVPAEGTLGDRIIKANKSGSSIIFPRGH